LLPLPRLEPVPPPPLARYQQLLRGRQAEGSVSLGTPLRGRLYHAAMLPVAGPYHVVIPRARARRTHFGTDELVELLRYAGREVARRHPGSRLAVSNMSRYRGGWLRYSRSHQSGRDADLAFYVRYRGRPVTPRHLRHFGIDLRARGKEALEFDLRRNWALVRALLTHPTVQIQWLIVAPHLERALLAHARRLREPAVLLQRARRVLHLPPGIRSHDDHFHLRIYCAQDDRLVGCRDERPFWPGVLTFDRALRRRVSELLPGLADPSPRVRQRVLRRLGQLDGRAAAAVIARVGLSSRHRAVRRRVLRLLHRWRSRDPAVIDALRDLIERPGAAVRTPGNRATGKRNGPAAARRDDPRWDRHRSATQLRWAYRILARTRGGGTTRILARGLRTRREVLGRGRRGYVLPEALLAAVAARYQADLALVPPLLGLLEHPHRPTRQAARYALRWLTNHDPAHWRARARARARQPTRRGPALRGAATLRRRPGPRVRRVARLWRRWWRDHRHLGRDALVRRGFEQVVPRFAAMGIEDRLRVWVRMTRRHDHLGDNAHAALKRFAGPPVFRHTAPPEKGRYPYWRRWLRRRRLVRLRRWRSPSVLLAPRAPRVGRASAPEGS
jgi:penicillin-insensitive murein endopeptidase